MVRDDDGEKALIANKTRNINRQAETSNQKNHFEKMMSGCRILSLAGFLSIGMSLLLFNILYLPPRELELVRQADSILKAPVVPAVMRMKNSEKNEEAASKSFEEGHDEVGAEVLDEEAIPKDIKNKKDVSKAVGALDIALRDGSGDKDGKKVGKKKSVYEKPKAEVPTLKSKEMGRKGAGKVKKVVEKIEKDEEEDNTEYEDSSEEDSEEEGDVMGLDIKKGVKNDMAEDVDEDGEETGETEETDESDKGVEVSVGRSKVGWAERKEDIEDADDVNVEGDEKVGAVEKIEEEVEDEDEKEAQKESVRDNLDEGDDGGEDEGDDGSENGDGKDDEGEMSSKFSEKDVEVVTWEEDEDDSSEYDAVVTVVSDM